jgi:hypothetical protein
VAHLKVELAGKQAKLDSERQGRQVTEEALRSQVGELERRKEDALATLKEAYEKSDGFKRDCEGTRVLSCFFFFLCLLIF